MFEKLSDEQIENMIARWTFGEPERRKVFTQKIKSACGERGLKILFAMWRNRYLTVDGYGDVQVTGRWADYQNKKRVVDEETRKNGTT